MLSPNQWFDGFGNFSDGYAPVKLNGKWNFIDTQGKLVSPNQWFDDVGDFYDGYAKVELNGKWNFIDTQGNIIYYRSHCKYRILYYLCGVKQMRNICYFLYYK